MSWIDELLAATADMESPRQYWYWSGLATISGVIRNSVWVERPIGGRLLRVYPNTYVILIGPPGIGKGPPVALAQTLLEQISDIRVISGRNSIQSIIQSLATTKTTAKGGPPIVHNCGSIISDELSTALVRDPDALTILTTLYDGQFHEEWKNTLKHSGVERLRNANLTLFGALNETHFEDLITQKDIEGGFIGRCVLVVAKSRAKKNPGLRKIEGQSVLEPDKLLPYLQKLATLKGPFEIEEGALVLYEEWYHKFEPEKSEDKTGAMYRVKDMILKIAQIIALSRRPMLIIQEADMKDAMTICLGTVAPNIKKVTHGIGASELAAAQRRFLKIMAAQENFTISRHKLLQLSLDDIDTYSLDRIVETLIQAKYIEQGRARQPDNSFDVTYTLTPKIIQEIFGEVKGNDAM